MKIKIYTTPVCPYCIALKNYLKEKGFSFEEIDVSKDEKKAQEMIKKTGQMGVPVVEIDDDLIVGFDKEKINKVLGIK